MRIRIFLIIAILLFCNCNELLSQRSFNSVVNNANATTIRQKRNNVIKKSKPIVTQFMGIPVDGSKTSLVWDLMDKGFDLVPYTRDVLEGEFNGTNVTVSVVTNKNKVWRIAIVDKAKTNQVNAMIRFNRLCEQFENNERYISFDGDQTIPMTENIHEGINNKNKQYSAVFYQTTQQELDIQTAQLEVLEQMREKFTEEEISNMTETEFQEHMSDLSFDYVIDQYRNRMVWFTICEDEEGFYIAMYYDNIYNEAKGEDL